MKFKLISICIISIVLSGCGTSSIGRQVNKNVDLTYDSKNEWAVQIRQTAKDTYLYAQMASNAYDDWDGNNRHGALDFKFPDNVVLLKQVGNDDVGLAYDLYEITSDQENSEIVIAFRGSEPNWTDWWTGNVYGKQLPRSLKVYDTVHEKYPTHDISVTGDSLGGSLATQISLCHPVKISVSIDTSPRFSSKYCSPGSAILDPNNRHSITERGEALKYLRIFSERGYSKVYVNRLYQRKPY